LIRRACHTHTHDLSSRSLACRLRLGLPSLSAKSLPTLRWGADGCKVTAFDAKTAPTGAKSPIIGWACSLVGGVKGTSSGGGGWAFRKDTRQGRGEVQRHRQPSRPPHGQSPTLRGGEIARRVVRNEGYRRTVVRTVLAPRQTNSGMVISPLGPLQSQGAPCHAATLTSSAGGPRGQKVQRLDIHRSGMPQLRFGLP
jgi:hypothetical protein